MIIKYIFLNNEDKIIVKYELFESHHFFLLV